MGTLLYLHTHFGCAVLSRHFSRSVYARIGGRHMTGTVLDLHLTALPRHLSSNFPSRQIRGSSHGTQSNKNNQIKIGTPEAHSGPGKGAPKKTGRKPAQLCKILDWKKILRFPGMKLTKFEKWKKNRQKRVSFHAQKPCSLPSQNKQKSKIPKNRPHTRYSFPALQGKFHVFFQNPKTGMGLGTFKRADMW